MLAETMVHFFFLKKSAALLPLKELSFLAVLWGHRFEMHVVFNADLLGRALAVVTRNGHALA